MCRAVYRHALILLLVRHHGDWDQVGGAYRPLYLDSSTEFFQIETVSRILYKHRCKKTTTKNYRMEPSVTSAAAPHSVKRWQLGGTDYEPAAGVRNLRSGRLLSAWTPLGYKTGNQQVRGLLFFFFSLNFKFVYFIADREGRKAHKRLFPPYFNLSLFVISR